MDKEIIYMYCWGFHVRWTDFDFDDTVRIIYRYDPVPYTGGRKGYKRGNRWYCNLNTQQERKWYFSCPELVRDKRKPKYLPTRRDEVINSKMHTYSWKRTKKEKQWM